MEERKAVFFFYFKNITYSSLTYSQSQTGESVSIYCRGCAHTAGNGDDAESV